MFRNKEIKVFTFVSIGVITFGIAVCLVLYPKAAWLMLLFSLSLFLSFLFFTWRRYQQLDRLSVYLRCIANGDFQLDIRDNAEGELSILKNEIYKVTVTLYEQAKLLQEDKLFLSDTLSDISHQLKTPLTSM
ncbi:MAG TPA: two-component sensor histidine kinase, partial [Clostridiales bacterium]|nr:two-component sensor histidine kinase [Clostridiales bacterium]